MVSKRQYGEDSAAWHAAEGGERIAARGSGKLADEFIATMNHAAERAVPEAVLIFGDTIKNMTLKDAQGILQERMIQPHNIFVKTVERDLPRRYPLIVKQATEKAGVTSAYKNMVGKAGVMGGLVDGSSLDLDKYVTDKTLDGLFRTGCRGETDSPKPIGAQHRPAQKGVWHAG